MPGGPAALAIAPESPLQDDVRALFAQSDAFSAALYPPDSNHTVDAETLAQPAVRFLVARIDGAVVGCVALVLGEAGQAELKRMFVAPNARRQGIAARLLTAIEAVARREGVRLLQLETGVFSVAAIGLYRRCGYRERGLFGSYRPDPLSIFMERDLQV
jgi:putative acetyltransferase